MGEQISDIVFKIDGSTLMVAEALWRGMADELQELHYLKGAQFINQLKQIIYYGEFHPVEGETNIYSAINENSDDFDNLINAARKAVEHGYRVYMILLGKRIAYYSTLQLIITHVYLPKTYDAILSGMLMLLRF